MTGDSRLDNQLAKLYALCDKAVLLNDPLVRSGQRGGTKTEHHEPGRQQAEQLIVLIEDDLKAVVASVSAKVANTRLREPLTAAQKADRKEREEKKAEVDAAREQLAREMAQKKAERRKAQSMAAIRHRNRLTRDTSGLVQNAVD